MIQRSPNFVKSSHVQSFTVKPKSCTSSYIQSLLYSIYNSKKNDSKSSSIIQPTFHFNFPTHGFYLIFSDK